MSAGTPFLITKMKRIGSFSIDHNRLQRGIFISRRDVTENGDVVTTFDIRMTLPNREDYIQPRAMHALEHLGATFLRNHPYWKDYIIYWGPMGCCTGFYLIVKGDRESSEMVQPLRETMEFIAGFDGDIPGASAVECGNYTFMDKDGAKKAAVSYLETLRNIKEENLLYPE